MRDEEDEFITVGNGSSRHGSLLVGLKIGDLLDCGKVCVGDARRCRSRRECL